MNRQPERGPILAGSVNIFYRTLACPENKSVRLSCASPVDGTQE
jgi:hypothetical protein